MRLKEFVYSLCIAVFASSLSAAPPPPKSVAATDGTYPDKVRITWKASAGAASYEVWRGTSDKTTSATRINTRTVPSHDDTSATPGTSYYYWIKAKNGSGTSGFSVNDTGYRISIAFREYSSAYGHDDFTDSSHPWKAVETGKTDTLRAAVTPSGAYKRVTFTSSSSSRVSVSPASPTSATQVLANKAGSSRGTAQIYARVDGSTFTYYKAAAYRKVQKTVAITLVNEQDTDGNGSNRGYTSVNIADSLIVSELQKVYKQAVVEWTVVRRPTCTVNFDVNNDGKIDVNGWMTVEMQKIRDACRSDHAYNIFLVSRPSRSATGSMMFNQKYGFVHADNGGSQTVAHELGHGAWGMEHTASDRENVMYNAYVPTSWRLRKNQWDLVNP